MSIANNSALAGFSLCGFVSSFDYDEDISYDTALILQSDAEDPPSCVKGEEYMGCYFMWTREVELHINDYFMIWDMFLNESYDDLFDLKIAMKAVLYPKWRMIPDDDSIHECIVCNRTSFGPSCEYGWDDRYDGGFTRIICNRSMRIIVGLALRTIAKYTILRDEISPRDILIKIFDIMTDKRIYMLR